MERQNGAGPNHGRNHGRAGGIEKQRPSPSQPESENQRTDLATPRARKRLPDRRASDLFDFEHRGVRYTAGVSFFGADEPAEIFIDVAKPGSAIAEHAHDAAVLASLLLQHGVSAAEIRHSISGPLSTALAMIEEGAR